jgi:hypothetical protein
MKGGIGSRRVTAGIFLAGLVAAGYPFAGCSGDDEEGPDDGAVSDADTGPDAPPDAPPDFPVEVPPDAPAESSEVPVDALDVAADETSAGTATVSGTAGRGTGTCPAGYGSVGTLCVSLRASCSEPATEVAEARVADADMIFPLGYGGPLGESPPVPFSVSGVSDGAWQLHAFLDRDRSGCAAPGTGDLVRAAGCLAVEVSGGADVGGVAVVFDRITP